MHSLLLRAWSSNPGHYSERIVRYLTVRPVKRLDIGYDIAAGGADIFAAVSRTAVATASAFCSDASFIDLENVILNVAPEWERERGQEGLTELALLRALAPERLGEIAGQRIEELELCFPNAPEPGAPKPLTRENKAQRVLAPISEEVQQDMSDDQWLSAMTNHIDEGPIFVGDQVVGGAEELSRDLKKLVAKNPERFSRLAGRMKATLPPTYFEAILNGLSDNGNGSVRSGTLEQVCSVLRRIKGLGIQVHGREVAWAIRAVGGRNFT